MKKHFFSPTHASTLKTNPPLDVKERVKKLDQIVNELQMAVAKDEQHFDILEKETNKHYTSLNNHIKSLRKAFNTLTDVVMEEIESIKVDVRRDVQDSSLILSKKIEELTKQLRGCQTEEQDQKIHVIAMEQELRDRIKVLERKIEEQGQYLQHLMDTHKEENKFLFEKLKTVATNNTSQLEILTRDNAKLNTELLELRSRADHDHSHLSELQHRIGELEEFVRHNNVELNSQLERTREKIRSESQNLLKSQAELSKRIEETFMRLNERLDANELLQKQKFFDIDSTLTRIQHDVNESLDHYGNLQKETSMQIINDMERALDSVGSDVKVLYKKLGTLETIVSRNKEEITTILSENERKMARRNDQVNEAIYDICRQARLNNPLL